MSPPSFCKTEARRSMIVVACASLRFGKMRMQTVDTAGCFCFSSSSLASPGAGWLMSLSHAFCWSLLTGFP